MEKSFLLRSKWTLDIAWTLSCCCKKGCAGEKSPDKVQSVWDLLRCRAPFSNKRANYICMHAVHSATDSQQTIAIGIRSGLFLYSGISFACFQHSAMQALSKSASRTCQCMAPEFWNVRTLTCLVPCPVSRGRSTVAYLLDKRNSHRIKAW
eukprot:1161961-Pelagomonas_calceolata.AAC.8